ncbi:MAG: hypothetical protein K2K06_07540 [Oscillospiraceae bacterium]|nr:hypothetical protein [Oscillospiraceae bacterium]
MTDEQEKKRAWLRRAKTIEKYVHALNEKVLQYDELKKSLLIFDDLDSEKIVQKLEQSVQEQQQKIEELLNALEKIQDAIFQVYDDVLGAILTRHYLLYETIDTIAENLHYDRRWIQKKHLKALDKIVMHKVKGESAE